MERTDYGHRPLYLAIEALRMRIEAESLAATDVGLPALSPDLIKEALCNCVAHNNWLMGPPSVLLFDNRLEFHNYLQPGDHVDLKGYPKNPSLFKALRAVGFASGLRRGGEVLSNYEGYKCKNPDETEYCVTLYFEMPISAVRERKMKRKAMPLPESQAKVLTLLKDDPSLRAEDIAYLIGRSKKSVERCFLALQEKGYLRRQGSKRFGHWEVLRES